MNKNKSRPEELKEIYKLEKHSEGGWFSEIYTAPFEKGHRALAGNIYFLLDKEEISHFHKIDCDEIWFYHEGCGLKITVLIENENFKHEYFLGTDIQHGELHTAVIPKGAVFAAENLNKNSYTFISCVTVPKFLYEGFRLIGKNEIKEKFPKIFNEINYFAYEDNSL